MTSLYPTQVTHADESYRLTVTLNEADGTFEYSDFRQSAEWKAEFTDDGFRLGGEMKWQCHGWSHEGFLGKLFAH